MERKERKGEERRLIEGGRYKKVYRSEDRRGLDEEIEETGLDWDEDVRESKGESGE